MSNRLFLRTLKTHPRLFSAITLGIAAGLLLPVAWVPHAATRLLIAWSLGTGSYLLMAADMIRHATLETMRRRARIESETRLVTIALVIVAAVAGLIAIVAQLASVKDMHGSLKAGHMGLAGLTILLSWAFTHTMFALHYAHDYYDAIAHQQPGGLEFPGTDKPEYGDFLYFAFVIGTSGQTADVSFTSKPMRRLGLVHCVLAFLFNTVVLAMTINIAASFI